MIPIIGKLLTIGIKKELVDFFKNLSLMAESGLPIDESLGVLALQARSMNFRHFLNKAKREVERGSPLSKAMAPYREVLGDLALNVIRAGEINGTLEDNLKYLADILNRRRELKQKLNAALLYPEIVLVLSFVLGGGISIYVLPKLIPLFRSLDVELPLATKILLALSLYLKDRGVETFLGLAALFVILAMVRRLPGFRWVFDTITLHIPFFGKLSRDYQLALFSQIFGTLFRSGLTIKEALTATAAAMTNIRYRHALMGSVRRLTSGVPLATILNRYPALFPQNVVAIVSVGEKSGKLEESFNYLAAFFDNEVDVQTKRLPTLLEPLLLVVIGCVVGFVALAIISPIYELTSGLSSRR